MRDKKRPEVLELLASKLRISGPLAARDLQRLVELSQPQLSRYLKILDSNLIKIGSGKNTRYAHKKNLDQVGSQIPIYRVSLTGRLELFGTLYPTYPSGFYWKAKDLNSSQIFNDLPYFLNDLRPSGYLGRLIPRLHPDWSFPQDIRLWTAESTLRYLANFGVDLIGDLIVGENAAQKFLEGSLQSSSNTRKISSTDYYEQLASEIEIKGIPGSSAGGEHPKFVTRRPNDGIPVLVKFVKNSNNKITKRRVDLLIAEDLATRVLSNDKSEASTRIVYGKNYTFLEVIRFDRAGTFGRNGIISLLSLDAEFIGSGESWSTVAHRLLEQKIITSTIEKQIQFREYFGQMIANTDMHGGNISFYFSNQAVIGLTPVYDMLPMRYAPVQETLFSEKIALIPPKPSSLSVWEEAREQAAKFWRQLQKTKDLTSDFIEIASKNYEVISKTLR